MGQSMIICSLDIKSTYNLIVISNVILNTLTQLLELEEKKANDKNKEKKS